MAFTPPLCNLFPKVQPEVSMFSHPIYDAYFEAYKCGILDLAIWTWM